MNLTNQELIQELQKRVKEGTLNLKFIPGQEKRETHSLLSRLDGKTLLLLLGLTAGFTLAVCSLLKITTTKAVEVELEFDQNPPIKVSPSVTVNKNEPSNTDNYFPI